MFLHKLYKFVSELFLKSLKTQKNHKFLPFFCRVSFCLCHISAAKPGLKISFTGPSDKMSDGCEFGSDMCMMMSDDLQFSLAPK
jgi:hypothetical protein